MQNVLLFVLLMVLLVKNLKCFHAQLQEPESAVERLEQPLDEMVAAHLRACWAWSNSGKSSMFQ